MGYFLISIVLNILLFLKGEKIFFLENELYPVVFDQKFQDFPGEAYIVLHSLLLLHVVGVNQIVSCPKEGEIKKPF